MLDIFQVLEQGEVIDHNSHYGVIAIWDEATLVRLFSQVEDDAWTEINSIGLDESTKSNAQRVAAAMITEYAQYMEMKEDDAESAKRFKEHF